MDRWLQRILLGCLAACACASRSPRFADVPVVWYADDARPIARPKPRHFAHIGYFTDILVLRRLTRAMEIRDLEPAHNVNALDEVPNSTWFTNRIGVRRISPAEAARGPVVEPPPRLPLRVVDGKTGGRNPGFLAEDATGDKFLIKFDRPKNPDMQSGTDVIVSRIFWALGYNVPQETLLYFHRHDLVLDPKAEYSPSVGKPRPMTRADLDAMLEVSPRQPDGSYRVLASRLLAGVPLGGPPSEGMRPDDPNDTVPHEHRRELRGLRVFAAWVHHTDVKEDNFLDMYVQQDGRRFVRHYMVDFGEALGAHQAEFDRPEDGFEFIVDWEKNNLALLALGLWTRPWEEQRLTPWPTVGYFSARWFDPVRWREAYPFWPFFEMGPDDAYWAAKIVMRFDAPTLRAIVDTAEFSPAASVYLVDTLLARARAIGRAHIESLTPLDAFYFEDTKLCAHDLGVAYGLADAGAVERLDANGVVVSRSAVEPDATVCLPVADHGRYAIARLRTVRGDDRRPVMQVHFKTGDRPRILGIIRAEDGPCIRGRGRPRCP